MLIFTPDMYYSNPTTETTEAMGDVFEKSLDEIIGENKSYRGSRGPRRERGPRRDRSPTRDSPPRRSDRRDRDRSSDRSGRRGGRSDRGDDMLAFREGESVKRRAHRLMRDRYYIKITDLHYNVTEEDLGKLLDRVGPLAFHFIEFDRSGRSTGVAYAQFKKLEDNRYAVQDFDGKKAAGQTITVELIKPLRIAPVAREEREREDRSARGSGRRERRKKATAEDLDNDLDSYMNGDADVDVEEKKNTESRPQRVQHHKKSKATAEDLDKELEAYMQQDNDDKPFAAIE